MDVLQTDDEPTTGTALECLTPGERRVLACVVDGLTDRAVARRLGIAEGTVRKHLEHTYRKLGVSNRVAATVIWLDGQPTRR